MPLTPPSPTVLEEVAEIGELQVRLPAVPGRLTYVDEIYDAFESDLNQKVEFLDSVDLEDAEVCVYLYGSDLARLVDTTRRVLGELDVVAGAYAVLAVPGQDTHNRVACLDL